MLSVEPKAEADNNCRDLDFSGYHQSRILYISLLYIVLKKKSNANVVELLSWKDMTLTFTFLPLN